MHIVSKTVVLKTTVTLSGMAFIVCHNIALGQFVIISPKSEHTQNEQYLQKLLSQQISHNPQNNPQNTATDITTDTINRQSEPLTVIYGDGFYIKSASVQHNRQTLIRSHHNESITPTLSTHQNIDNQKFADLSVVDNVNNVDGDLVQNPYLIVRPNTANATNSQHNTTLITKLDQQRSSQDLQKTAIRLSKLNQFYDKHNDQSCIGTWRSPLSAPLSHDGTLRALAHRGYYDNLNYAELAGDVRVSQFGKNIHADRLQLNTQTGQATAVGNVLFGGNDDPKGTGDLMGIAEQLTYNTQTGRALAYDIAFASKNLHAHGYAKKLTHPATHLYTMNDVLFSTCPPQQRTWHLSAKNIDINTAAGRALAQHATFNIKDRSVFYLPYFSFAIDNRRSSGFLLPKLGINSNDGLHITTPYYLNLAPNYDATLAPTFYTNRNWRIAGEFRHLSHFGKTTIQGAYLPNDKKYNHQDRHHLFADYAWQISTLPNVNIFAKYQQVSDGHYLRDFEGLGINKTTPNLPRQLGVNYNNDFLNSKLQFASFQKLQGQDHFGNPILDKDRPYSRLPQLLVDYSLGDDVKIQGRHNWGYFKKTINDNSDAQKSGVRLFNNLTISPLWAKPWGYIRPSFGISTLHMIYDEQSVLSQNLSKHDKNISVIVPHFAMEGALTLTKPSSPFFAQLLFGKNNGHQLITSKLNYRYTPYQDQSHFPNFESHFANISYEQLLADSWIIGDDRIQDLHALTPAINYRYIDGQGNTKLDAAAAWQFYITDGQVMLDGHTTPKSSSGLAWRASLSPKNNIWIDGAGSFDKDYASNTWLMMMRYQPYANTLFNAGFINRKSVPDVGQKPLNAYSASALFAVNPKWNVLGSVHFDAKSHQFMDTLVGVGYHDCCIGLSVYARQYRNEFNPNDKPNRTLMAEIHLHGLTPKGNLSKLLQQKVIGYENFYFHPNNVATP